MVVSTVLAVLPLIAVPSPWAWPLVWPGGVSSFDGDGGVGLIFSWFLVFV